MAHLCQMINVDYHKKKTITPDKVGRSFEHTMAVAVEAPLREV